MPSMQMLQCRNETDSECSDELDRGVAETDDVTLGDNIYLAGIEEICITWFTCKAWHFVFNFNFLIKINHGGFYFQWNTSFA